MREGLRCLKHFAFLEAYMRLHQFGKSQQRRCIRLLQRGDEIAQCPMLGQGAPNQIMFASLREGNQQATLLGTEMRIEFGDEKTGDMLRQPLYFARIARVRGTSGVKCELQRSVVVTREIQQIRMALHAGGFLAKL